MARVILEKITKSFGKFRALHDVSMNFDEGAFHAILGPSGSGKTTILRIIAGFEDYDSGSIHVGNESMENVPVEKRNIGMVFQNYALFPNMTVKDNVIFGLKVRKIKGEAAEKKVKNALELVHMESMSNRKPNQLSGGQRQRIALARALIKRPKVLLLDEPLGALDKKLRDEMQIELRNLQKAVGITFVFVTHDQGESISMSDRVAVMNEGKIQQISDPHDLYYNPHNIFVSDFIGTTNFLSAKTGVKNGDNIMVQIESIGEFSIENKLNLPENSNDVVCSIRPEAIELSTNPIEKGDIILEGEIENSSYYGELTSFYIKVEGADKPLIASSQRFDNNSFQDEKCYLAINFEDINLLKKE